MLFRHRLSFAVVAVALAALAAVFLFARPQYDSERGAEMIDFSTRTYRSPTEVRNAFAVHGVRLREAARFNGFVTLAVAPRPLTSDVLQVQVAPRDGKGSWGPVLQPYDERFDNVGVTYGGGDEALLERVEAAVEDLR